MAACQSALPEEIQVIGTLSALGRDIVGSLEFGIRSPLLARRESLRDSALGVRVCYLSDIHLGRCRRAKLFGQIISIVTRVKPDLILLGGDLVDRPDGLVGLMRLVIALGEMAPVAAVGGNHDRLVGLSCVRQAVIGGGGHWLEDRPFEWAQGLAIYGGYRQALLPSRRFHLLCAHDPAVFENACNRGFNLILGGHIHGGQIVFFKHDGRFYPGALLYSWNGPRFQRGETTMLVSRGVADTFPVRWNCPREVLWIEI